MSGEKVVRYTAEQMRKAADNMSLGMVGTSVAASMLRQAAQTEAEVARLAEALKAVLPFCVTGVLEHCDGNKCRESWCAGCSGDSEAADAVARSIAAQENARNALARFQP